MPAISAFVGHSFADEDKPLIDRFLAFFHEVEGSFPDFAWDHAQRAEPKELADKVRQKMEGRNLFIGICTAKESVIDPAHLTKCTLPKRYLKAPSHEFQSKTSDWMIQEIGFACGRDMELILFLEGGLRTPGGLQGNTEYIPFDRDQLDQCQTKFLQMIQALLNKYLPVQRATPDLAVQSVPSESASPQPPAGPRSPEADWSNDDYLGALLDAESAHDSAREELLSQRYLASPHAESEYNRARWQSSILYWHFVFQSENVLSALLEMQTAHPKHDFVKFAIGRIYESYKEYERAAVHMQESAEFATEPLLKVRRLLSASELFTKAGNHDKSRALLAKAREDPTYIADDSVRLAFLRTLAGIAHIKTNTQDYEAFYEAILEIKPDDHDTRFALGLKYLDDKQIDLALYHYDILTQRAPTSGNWHNLAVAAAQLGLPVRTVNAYREAERLGGTLAVNNLAHKLIDAGFLPEAEGLVAKATSQKDYNLQIGSVILRLKAVREEEDKKQSEILAKLPMRRNFYTHYARASLSPFNQIVSEEWDSDECPLTIYLTPTTIRANGTYQKPKGSSFLPIAFQPKAQETISVQVLYVGEVNGRAIRYSKWISEGAAAPKPSTTPSQTGLMVISEDHTSLDVCQRDAKGEYQFFKISRPKT